MAARHHLDGLAAVADELGEQRVLLGRREAVAAGVGDDGDAAGLADPAHGVAQARPAVRHEAGVAFGQVAPEHGMGVGADAALDEEAGEVRSRDELGVADVALCPFVGARDADLRQPFGHLARALAAAAARGRQAGIQGLVVGVEAQAHDVHGDAGEGDRDLGAGQVVHAQRQRRVACALLAAEFIVVGQRPQFHAVGMGALGQRFGGEGAVGDVAVAVEVGVDQVHGRILRSFIAPASACGRSARPAWGRG